MQTSKSLISLVFGFGLTFLSGCGVNKTEMSDKRQPSKDSTANTTKKDSSKGGISLRMPKEHKDKKVKTLRITLESQDYNCAVAQTGTSIDPVPQTLIAESSEGSSNTTAQKPNEKPDGRPQPPLGKPEPMPLPYPCDGYAEPYEGTGDGDDDVAVSQNIKGDDQCDGCIGHGTTPPREGSSTSYEFDFAEDSLVNLSDILPGSYHVVVSLIDFDGATLEEGDGFTDIQAGATSGLAIVLRPVSDTGNLEIQILHEDDITYAQQTDGSNGSKDDVVETAPLKK